MWERSADVAAGGRERFEAFGINRLTGVFVETVGAVVDSLECCNDLVASRLDLGFLPQVGVDPRRVLSGITGELVDRPVGTPLAVDLAVLAVESLQLGEKVLAGLLQIGFGHPLSIPQTFAAVNHREAGWAW